MFCKQIGITNLEILWSDGHKSTFKPTFFTKYGLNGTSGDHQGYNNNSGHELWKSDHEIPKYEYDQILKDEKIMLNWLEELCKKGIAIFGN